MSAVLTIKIRAIRTTTVGSHANVVKQVEWTMIGEQSGQRFELPQTTTLADPDGQPFIELTNLTEANVINWIETADAERVTGIKAHIQYVLDKLVAESALTVTAMPWAPVVETNTEV
jgi:hypothetical protein